MRCIPLINSSELTYFNWHRYGIEQVYLSGNPLGYDGILHISEAITASDTLCLLELSNCDLDDKGVIALQTALAANSTVKNINLSRNAAKSNLIARAEVSRSRTIPFIGSDIP
jgi:hypothetical protein